MTNGIFYGISVGPGDPELLTIQAAKTIARCAVLAAPQTRSGQMLALEIARRAVDLTGKILLPLPFTMERNTENSQDASRAAAGQIAPYLLDGQDVGMLNLGDVSLYASCTGVMDLLRQRGFETERIAGVPSFCAAAARLGISLANGNAPLHILPGAEPSPEQLGLPGTKILLKPGRETARTAARLRGMGYDAAAAENCGLPGERLFRSLEHVPEDIGYFTTFIIKEEL